MPGGVVGAEAVELALLLEPDSRGFILKPRLEKKASKIGYVFIPRLLISSGRQDKLDDYLLGAAFVVESIPYSGELRVDSKIKPNVRCGLWRAKSVKADRRRVR